MSSIEEVIGNTLKLPELGENIEQGVVVQINIAPGEQIRENQILFEVETDKVVVEIPSTEDGVIARILVSKGQEVRVGDALLELEPRRAIETGNRGAPPPVRAPNPDPQPAQTSVNTVLEKTLGPGLAFGANIIDLEAQKSPPAQTVPAGPSARRLARELGVEIARVKGSGRHGRISKNDVKDYARAQMKDPKPMPTAVAGSEPAPIAQAGEITAVAQRQPMTAIQLATSRNMSRAWREIPHAWVHDKIDVTQLERQRRRHKESFKARQISLSLTAFLVKAVALAIAEHRIFNATLDLERNEIVYRDGVDIGVAVDTPRGLVVPTVRAADQKSVALIATDITTLANNARSGKLALKDLDGAGITLSNLGNLGLNAIYPIVNWPQVAIVGAAAAQLEPRLIDGEWIERSLLPVTLAFDHRVINGADAARFIGHLKATLEDPFTFCIS